MGRRRYVSEEEWEAGEKYRVPFVEKSNIVIKPEPKEELYKWYPIVDEGEYWTDYDIAGPLPKEGREKIGTIVSDGTILYSYEECRLGWGTMAKRGWKYMRIKLD